mgnify:CR=1 FL=1
MISLMVTKTQFYLNEYYKCNASICDIEKIDNFVKSNNLKDSNLSIRPIYFTDKFKYSVVPYRKSDFNQKYFPYSQMILDFFIKTIKFNSIDKNNFINITKINGKTISIDEEINSKCIYENNLDDVIDIDNNLIKTSERLYARYNRKDFIQIDGDFYPINTYGEKIFLYDKNFNVFMYDVKNNSIQKSSAFKYVLNYFGKISNLHIYLNLYQAFNNSTDYNFNKLLSLNNLGFVDFIVYIKETINLRRS